MLDTQTVIATLVLEDAAGAPTAGTPDQPPVWTANPTGLVVLTPAADGMSCSIAGEAPGNAVLTATFTITPTGGTAVSFTATGQLALTAGAPTQVVMTFGTPTP